MPKERKDRSSRGKRNKKKQSEVPRAGDRNKVLETVIQVEITFKKEKVPRGKWRKLFEQLYGLIRKGAPFGKMVPLLYKIVQILRDHVRNHTT